MTNRFASNFNDGLWKATNSIDDIGMSPYSLPAANSISASVVNEVSGHVPYLTSTAIPRIFKCAGGDSSMTSEYSPILRRIMTASFTQVVNTFTRPDKAGRATFDAPRFYAEVFRKSADVWGFVMIYFDLLNKLLSTERLGRCDSRSELTVALQRLLTKYCLSATYADKPIPTNELVKELKQLNGWGGLGSPFLSTNAGFLRRIVLFSH